MPRPTSICFIITRLIAGGAQKILFDLISNLDRQQFDIHLIAGTETGKEGSLWEAFNDLLSKEKIFKCHFLKRSVSPANDMRAYFYIKKIIRSINPQIVHTHTSKAGVIGRLAAQHLHIPTLIHSTHGLIYSVDANIPGISGSLPLTFFKAVEKYLGRKTHHLITLSEQETGDAIKLQLAPPANILSIPNGIPLKHFSDIQRDITSWKVPHIRLGIAGRLNSEKGHDLLLKCFKKVLEKRPNVTLKIAGSGPLQNELEATAQQLNIQDQVVFCGYQNDIASFLAGIDIFVLSSHYEGFGLVLVEAMAAGLPIVATDVGGVREVIQDGKNGIIIPPGREDEMTMGIEYFLQNPELAYQFGQAGREHAMKNFSILNMVKKHIQLYQAQHHSETEHYIPEYPCKIDLHMHSLHSYDSKTKIETILEKSKANGLHAIAITDHDNIEGALIAKAQAPPGLMVIPGIEVTSDAGDIIGLFINQPIKSTEYKEAIAEIKAQGGIVYLPHPFRGRRSISLELLDLVDVFEVYNGRSQGIDIEHDNFGDQDIVNFAKTYNKTGVGGSDAHKPHEINRVTTHVPHFKTEDELKQILLSHKIYPVFSEKNWVKETLEDKFLSTHT